MVFRRPQDVNYDNPNSKKNPTPTQKLAQDL